MRILIGYSMRSGSTLLQHLLNEHSRLRSFSDISSLPVLATLACGIRLDGLCVKPLDLFYLPRRAPVLGWFDRHVWLARDPRDSYLSSIASGYAYLFQRRGDLEHGIDVDLLRRWRRIYRHYFRHRRTWRLVRYEDLAERPEPTMARLLEDLGLSREPVTEFRRFSLLSGGDWKLRRAGRVHAGSVGRHREQLTPDQQKVFTRHLGREMARLGYEPGDGPP
jgi:hypothetical protein